MFSDEKRRRIIEQARKNIDPVKLEADRQELARRLMSSPKPDPVERWKASAEARVTARMKSKAEIAAAEARDEPAPPAKPDWQEIDDRIYQAIVRERKLVFEAVGESVGQLIAEQHQRDREALHAETEKLWRMLESVRKTIAVLNALETGQRPPLDVVPVKTRVN